MKKSGFMPFSAAGALIVMLVLGMVAQTAWLRHQRSLSTTGDATTSSLLADTAEVHGELRSTVRYSVYRALWEVGKRASDYDDNGRKYAIESLATKYFRESLTELERAYPKHDARINLDISEESHWPNLIIEDNGDGYVLTRAGLPNDSYIELKSWDGTASLALMFENVEVFVDSRYFLLQQRMNDFLERQHEISNLWQMMEYVKSWSEAWATKNVELSHTHTEALFEAAWNLHELNTFGSSDYWAAAQLLIEKAQGMKTGKNPILGLEESRVLVNPIQAADIEVLNGYLGGAVRVLDDASNSLIDAERSVRVARETAVILNSSENKSALVNKIQTSLEKAKMSVLSATDKVSEVREQFNHLIESMAGSTSNNSLMSVIHQSLKSRSIDEGYPSFEEQVLWGTRGTLDKLLDINGAIASILMRLASGGFESHLEDHLKEIQSSIKQLLARPNPKRWVMVETYADKPPRLVEDRLPVCADDESDGTIGLLRFVLDGAKTNIEGMLKLSQRLEPSTEKLREFDIDDELQLRIKSGPPTFKIGREEFYELLPPPPIKKLPGISVYHEFRVKDVKYKRGDLAGLLGSPMATPIPLWPTGVTLWWGQWDVAVELEVQPVEEIFDFDNPTLPLAHGPYYLHKPLAYRWEIPERMFKTTVVVISLRPFTISSG